MKLSIADQELRGLLTRMIADTGRAPSITELAKGSRSSEQHVIDALKRLHDSHALLLHPNRIEPWVVHPFALSPGSCWVQTVYQGYWANCLYCAFGIVAASGGEARIYTRLAGEANAVVYEVNQAGAAPCDHVFHLSTPVSQWWDNVIHACSSFQPFRSAADINDWCDRHGFEKGALISIPQLWVFAQDWYGDYLSKPWRIRTTQEIESLFQKHGFTGPFWSLDKGV